MRERSKPSNCPTCGSDRIVPVIYGYTEDQGDRAILGGCRIPARPPKWGCAACRWVPYFPQPVPDRR